MGGERAGYPPAAILIMARMTPEVVAGTPSRAEFEGAADPHKAQDTEIGPAEGRRKAQDTEIGRAAGLRKALDGEHAPRTGLIETYDGVRVAPACPHKALNRDRQ